MIKIIADNKIPFLEGVLEPYAQVNYLPGAQTDASAIRDADALITRTRTRCNAATLDNSQVKIIATATIGFDHIDTLYCQNNHIEWTNAPGCNSGSVKQYIAATLATLISKHNMEIENKTIGIIGAGNVGRKVAKLAKAVGMKVLLNDPPRAQKEGSAGFVELEELIAESDIITFHVPLQHEGKNKTFHLGNKTFFSRCKRHVVIVNSSRGEVIDNEALLSALELGNIGNVVLDVWENEPGINRSLLQKTLIATPHIAGYSADGKANGTAMSVQAISQYFGFPLNQWYPQNIPSPQKSQITINAKGLTFQEIWTKAVLHTYSIAEDDARLRKSPDSFELLRGSYPLRREFEAYTLRIKNGTTQIIQKLSDMGFTHIEVI
ncbi:erythronate-4-phosphate dehydrogenase [Saccharicrinis carchari]|uniref:Erythronate-4-phosphate dehydrogenase n=1 Tax=Saccharicrinis carchari TaxID=1168039 RepID=A0A521CVH5_SACCC|nr:4-phosphoerythronate dehydrogenase PdxB [Saccharicrinis carchari]SMO62670.1 erythronate-4-phosphate dehydrogenase [Saccharicrinis carchari]